MDYLFNDDSFIYHTPFGTTTINPYIPHSGLTVGSPYTITSPTTWDSAALSTWSTELRNDAEKEMIKDVDIKDVKSSNKGEHIVVCENEKDLSIDRVLTTLSAAKGRLMIDIAPVHIKKIECSMTPIVRKNIITASKKLKMYGKPMPIVARFDEYGNRLPDTIELGMHQGVDLKIVEPDDANYNKFYFELKAVEFYCDDYTVTYKSLDDYTVTYESLDGTEIKKYIK